MASFKTSTGDVSFQLQNTESNPNINADGQNSGNKREDSVYEESANIEQDEQISGSKYVYEEPAITQRSGGQKEDKEPQANNWPVKCFMAMMIALVIAVVVLAVSKVSNYGIIAGINQVVWNFERPFSKIHDNKLDHYWTVFIKNTLIIFIEGLICNLEQ